MSFWKGWIKSIQKLEHVQAYLSESRLHRVNSCTPINCITQSGCLKLFWSFVTDIWWVSLRFFGPSCSIFHHISSYIIIYHLSSLHPIKLTSSHAAMPLLIRVTSIPDNFRVWMRSCQKFRSDGPRSTRLFNEVENWIPWDRDPYNGIQWSGIISI